MVHLLQNRHGVTQHELFNVLAHAFRASLDLHADQLVAQQVEHVMPELDQAGVADNSFLGCFTVDFQ